MLSLIILSLFFLVKKYVNTAVHKFVNNKNTVSNMFSLLNTAINNNTTNANAKSIVTKLFTSVNAFFILFSSFFFKCIQTFVCLFTTFLNTSKSNIHVVFEIINFFIEFFYRSFYFGIITQ